MTHFELLPGKDRFRVWARHHPTFQPRDWLVDLRQAIRHCLSNLHPVDGEVLYGRHISAVRDGCDTENVLFYNIGFRPFRSFCSTTVRFERSYDEPPPAPSGRVFPHQMDYVVCPELTTPYHWKIGPTAAMWTDALLRRRPSSASKPIDYWYALKRAGVTSAGAAPNREYCLLLTLHAPVSVIAADLVKWMKPMFDGVICAFHRNDRDPEQSVIDRHCARVSESETTLRSWLTASSAPLGYRRLFSKNGAWNPRDDDCVYGELRARCGGTEWKLSGQLCVVTRLSQEHA